MARILPASAGSVAEAVAHLSAGGLVALPTETVYGLAGDARSEEAVGKIFAVKGRPLVDPLIVHVADLAGAESVGELGPLARRLAAAFWPGPLTLVVKRRPGIPDLVTAGRPSVAVRVPAHSLAHAVLQAFGGPLAAPSANPFGYLSPTRAEHVAATLGNRVELILDGGPCAVGVESTIVDLRDEAAPAWLRPGGVALEDLAEVLGCALPDGRGDANAGIAAGVGELAPGLLAAHYQPRTPLLSFAPGAVPPAEPAGRAVIHFRRPAAPRQGDFWLTEDGDLGVAAAALFELLNRLDGGAWPALAVERAPDHGLGRAINDRLARAAAKRPSVSPAPL